MRNSLCTAPDHILTMLRRWVQKVVNDASRALDVAKSKIEDQLREFALAVKALAIDESPRRPTGPRFAGCIYRRPSAAKLGAPIVIALAPHVRYTLALIRGGLSS